MRREQVELMEEETQKLRVMDQFQRESRAKALDDLKLQVKLTEEELKLKEEAMAKELEGMREQAKIKENTFAQEHAFHEKKIELTTKEILSKADAEIEAMRRKVEARKALFPMGQLSTQQQEPQEEEEEEAMQQEQQYYTVRQIAMGANLHLHFSSVLSPKEWENILCKAGKMAAQHLFFKSKVRENGILVNAYAAKDIETIEWYVNDLARRQMLQHPLHKKAKEGGDSSSSSSQNKKMTVGMALGPNGQPIQTKQQSLRSLLVVVPPSSTGRGPI